MPASLLTVTPLTASGISHVFYNFPSQGLIGWYDATQVAGVVSGTSFSLWTDLSGMGHHLTRSADSTAPTYTTSSTSMNGQPVVRFDGVNDSIKTTFTSVNDPTTTAAALYLSAVSTANTEIWGLKIGGGRGIARTVSNSLFNLFQGAGFVPASLATASRSFSIIAIHGGSLSTIACQGSVFTGSLTTDVSNTYVLGAGDGGFWSQVDFGEFMAYNRALAPSEITLLLSYLTTKWGTL